MTSDQLGAGQEQKLNGSLVSVKEDEESTVIVITDASTGSQSRWSRALQVGTGGHPSFPACVLSGHLMIRAVLTLAIMQQTETASSGAHNTVGSICDLLSSSGWSVTVGLSSSWASVAAAFSEQASVKCEQFADISLSVLQAYWRNVKARPLFMLGPPVLVFCVLCALGIMGVALGADKLEADERSRAESAALDWVSNVADTCALVSAVVTQCCSWGCIIIIST